MLGKFAAEAGKSIWKEIGQDMLKKGASTAAVEGVKSVIEVFKKRKMMMDEYEFQKWKKAQDPEAEEDPKKAKSKEEKPKEDAPEDSQEKPKDPPEDPEEPGIPGPEEPQNPI